MGSVEIGSVRQKAHFFGSKDEVIYDPKFRLLASHKLISEPRVWAPKETRREKREVNLPYDGAWWDLQFQVGSCGLLQG